MLHYRRKLITLGVAVLACVPLIRADGPVDRFDFQAIAINNDLYVTGGNLEAPDMWHLDLSKDLVAAQPHWEVPANYQPPAGSFQPFLYGVGFRGANDNNIYVQAGDGGGEQMAYLAMYDTAGQWSTVNVKGIMPLPRAQMTANANNNTGMTWFYGGRSAKDSTKAYYNDFYTFDTQSSSWSQYSVPEPYGPRPPRYAHSANLIMDQLFIMGGRTAAQNTGDNSWSEAFADFHSVLVFDTVEKKAVSMETIGDIPNPRLDVIAPDGRSIVIYGGHHLDQTNFTADNDVYVLDTCKLRWSKPSVKGTPPTARAGHRAVTHGNYMLVMLGYSDVVDKAPVFVNDVAILDMKSWEWVDSMSGQNQVQAKPECRYEFPPLPSTNQGAGTKPMIYDTTVIENPWANDPADDKKKKGFSISFSLFGFFLILGAAFFFYRRRQRRKARTANPRWLPGALSSDQPYVKPDDDYPLFVYNANEKRDEETATAVPLPDITRTYTATDHAQSRQDEPSSVKHPADIWDRMRDLGQHHNQQQQPHP
ncbi:uncharacterized protein BYT42DRAFT_543763 [Radiomyces spectabilis]|uniref:uncharacterized protein n=1 Tax=Radiomyces spectabilis TaxID=64574 RepID=UPI00221FEC0A|nr:uncharacterized protein BYT42DRAFT_543763 [Radiomyces spectabilis]KAI8388468.1 hypothetical protein BYT42DRAFT_543763 [Radiomyces spectabilis]